MVGLWCLNKIFKKQFIAKKMHRFIKHSCTLIIAAIALVQCTKDFNDISVGESHNASATKIINCSDSAVNGTMLVKFNESGALSFEKASRSAGVTRSNIEPLNKTLTDINAVSIERLFPIDIRNEERTRAAGLHRWYIVHFDETMPLDNVARQLASIGEVEKVEFCQQTKRPTQKPRIEKAESRNATRLETPTFNDPYSHLQWDFKNTGDKSLGQNAIAGMDINVAEAWKYTTGDNSIVVAIIDEGVAYDHEDLATNMWRNVDEIPNNGIDDDGNGFIDDVYGYNVVDNFNNEDGTVHPISWGKDGDVSHGIHVAGTIAAVNNNGIGINGIAGGNGSGNGVRIMSAQVYSGKNNKGGSNAVTAMAFKYAADNGAVICNCSWGIDSSDKYNDSWYVKNSGVEKDAIDYFQKAKNHPNLDGGIVIFAAGNDGEGQASYPGAYRDYISVSATGIDGLPVWYTNYGPGCNISAPGGDANVNVPKSDIYSTIDDKKGNIYGYMQGTSMACPHVTGVVALGLAYAKKLNKTFTTDEFKSKLLLSVNDIDNDISNAGSSYSEYIRNMGTGRIDAFKFLMNLEGTTCITVPRGVPYHKIDISQFLDGINPKIISAELSTSDKKRLDVTFLRVSPMHNTIDITCNNSGSAIMTVKFIAGGDELGTNDNLGGMTITKRFALVVRNGYAENGGWL